MSNNQKYIRVCTSLYDTGRLIKKEDLDKVLQRDDIHELYASTFYYNEEQYKEFQLKKSIKGVRNVKTDKIWFDFDNETNPELSRKDAIIVIDRLKKAGFKEKAIQVYFSGSKGINVIVNLNKDLNPVQVSTICSKFAKDLETFDTSMYDSAQILRVPTTKHQKTNNYKIPITIDELNKLDINQIKQKSSKIDKQEMLAKSNQWESDILPDGLDIVEAEPVKEKREPMTFDLKNKPREWRDYKWALLNAYMVKPEERHASLMVLAATCRSLGYTEEYAKAMCLVFDEKFVKATGKPPVEDLESNILPAVYSDTWNGGAYSYKNNLFLQQYVSRIGAEPEKNDKTILSIDDVFTEFEDFSQNFEKNIVKTGILDLDMNSLFLTSTHNGILGQPGSGKCLGKDTPVIMFDGSVKMVQDVKTGDLLMGDDSTPRKVLGTTKGIDNLYKIKQRNGDDYVVNSCHILSLKGSSNRPNQDISYGKIHDINIQDYLKKTGNFKKRVKGYKVPVEFNEKEQTIEPYYLGYWLGNGTSEKTQITMHEEHIPIFNYLERYCTKLGLNFIVRKDKDGGKAVSVELNTTQWSGEKNVLKDWLRSLNLLNNKHIPMNYLTGSRTQRLSLLAGLLDSDGYSDSRGNYEITQKNKTLSNQIVFLARSLGYKVSINECTKGFKDFKGTYYRVNIMSDDFTDLPLLLDYKKVNKIERQRYYDLTEIKVEEMGVGEYYGFEIDGNHRFLLGDFTVTHNTSLVIQWLEYLSNKGESCFFYSLDMAESIIYAKLVQRITGYDTRKSMSLSKSNPAEFIEVTKKIKEKYKNIQFVFTAGTTVDSMKEGIRKYESESGNKVRLVIVDYLECLTGPYSDATANTGFISQQMKDLAREMRVCSVMLLQTQKNSGGGDVSEPLLSMKQIKGSSVIEQSCATILTLWREGYSPKFQNQDKFMSFAIVKNRFGRLWTDDFGWEGQRGQVGNILGDEGREDLNKLRQEKKAAKAADNKDDGWN